MLGGVCHEEFYRYSDQEVQTIAHESNLKAFVIFVHHTSFQLYYCEFPWEYLRKVHDDGIANDDNIMLKVTQPYNFCDVKQRREWFDIVVALIQYLQSGESRVGFLNRNADRNMLHKEIEMQLEIDESQIDSEEGPSEKSRTGWISLDSNSNIRADSAFQKTRCKMNCSRIRTRGDVRTRFGKNAMDYVQ